MPTADNATETLHPSIVTGFGYSPLPAALWRTDAATGLEFRDLSLTAASRRALRSRHLRSGDAPVATQTLSPGGAMFGFIFVLKGSVDVTADGRTTTIGHFGAVTQEGVGETAWRIAPHTELLEVSATRALWPTTGPARWAISHDAADAYKVGDGPRKFFDYRDLDVAGLTDRRIHIHIVRAAGPPDAGGTGWHCHTMGQLFYVLNGSADLTVADQPWLRMETGDAMCLAPGMRHNVPGFTADYAVIEMCVPADYETIDTPAPDA